MCSSPYDYRGNSHNDTDGNGSHTKCKAGPVVRDGDSHHNSRHEDSRMRPGKSISQINSFAYINKFGLWRILPNSHHCVGLQEFRVFEKLHRHPTFDENI